nr:DUF418 domain-containing protein [Rhizobium leguminosarum]
MTRLRRRWADAADRRALVKQRSEPLTSLCQSAKRSWRQVTISRRREIAKRTYCCKFVGIAYLLRIMGIDSVGEDGSLSMLFGFVVAIGTFAVLWLRAFQRGPMEVLMGRITDLARHIL